MTLRSASEFFTTTMMGYRTAKALLVANKMGVFEALEGRALDAGALGAALGSDAEKLLLLLRALAGIGLLEVESGRFRNSAFASAHLVRGRPGYAGDNLRFQEILWEGWSNLEGVVRSGAPWDDLGSLLAREDQAFTREYIRGMHNIATQPAAAVAELLGPRPLARMLDLGAGPGTYALALAARHEALLATLFDLPTTLAVTRELVGGHPLAARLSFVAGDYTEDDYGSGFDLVLMSHVTHDEDPATVARMLDRAHRALEPGGRIAIHDWVVGESGTEPLSAALFSLNLAVYTKGGRIYTAGEYTRLLEAAGFRSFSAQTVLPASANPTTLITATRPGPGG